MSAADAEARLDTALARLRAVRGVELTVAPDLDWRRGAALEAALGAALGARRVRAVAEIAVVVLAAGLVLAAVLRCAAC